MLETMREEKHIELRIFSCVLVDDRYVCVTNEMNWNNAALQKEQSSCEPCRGGVRSWKNSGEGIIYTGTE